MLQILTALISSSFALKDQCPAGNAFTRFGPAAAFMLMASSPNKATGFASNLSLGPTSEFYFSLSPFESIMLGLIVLKLMLLRYLDILPIDINKLVDGENPFGRKKRSTDPKILQEKERLAETMFTILRRLDMQDCLLRTLCELQIHSLQGHKLPRETKLTLSALSKSGWKRKKNQKPNLNPDVIEDRPVLSVFEDAVHIGWNAKNLSGTECQERYFICPLTKTEIFNHFDTIKIINIL